MGIQLVLWFSEITKNDNGIVGGKGTNLGVMYNLKLAVPSGFVVTAQAYKYFTEITNIQNEILNVLKGLDVEDTTKLQSASEKIQEIILDAKMPDAIKNAIIEAYDDMNVDRAVSKVVGKDVLNTFIKAGRDAPFVAVRSSATAEDQPSISENEYVLVKLNGKPFFGKMKELANSVGYNDEIIVPAMDNFSIGWKRVSNIYRHKVDAKFLYKITTSTGKQITISPNHTLIVLDERTLQPKVTEVAGLKGNEKIPVIKNIPLIDSIKEIEILDYISKEDVTDYNNTLMIKNKSNNWKIQQGLPKRIKISKDFAYFLGVYAAEGTTYKNNEIIITNSNNQIIDRIRTFIASLGINSDIKINKYSLRFYCKTLVRFLNENCGIPDSKIKGKGKTCMTKEVPSFIFATSKEIIGEYLKGYFDGDGTVDKMVNCSSTSQKLIAGISTLLELLNIEFYILNKKKSRENWHDKWIINLPLKELEKYKNFVGFFHENKAKKLNQLLNNYNLIEKHMQFKNSFTISKEFAHQIREFIDSNLPKERVIIALCPQCSHNINKSSKYKGLERFYCSDCKKAFYEDQVIKTATEKYINYDSKGRFLKSSVPWNKSINTYPSYGESRFRQILSKNGLVQLAEPLFTDSIIWDKILKIEEVNYDSYVYDFTIPSVENFAAGFGGIITHNSASFAGQQATYLNVRGKDDLVLAVQKCWASLFTARAIYYRTKNNFPHDKVLIAVVIQKMVNSEKSGVMFSVNPATNNESEIMIEAAFGLGEVVVGGEITPDTYIVDKTTLKIKSRKVAKQEYGIFRDQYTGKNIKRKLNENEASKQKLFDEEILTLAKYAKTLEDHYGKPMDSEWATENGKIYLVQTRPITTLIRKKAEAQRVENKDLKPILSGMGASPGVGVGKVKTIKDMNELNKVEKGDVLVTRMTSPDYVPAMKKAVAIVTDEGGITSHASIVSRELGIPCIVGTEKATQLFHDGDLITVDGTNGVVYSGDVGSGISKVEVKQETSKVNEINLQENGEIITGTKINMNLGEPEKIDDYKQLPFDGIGLMRIEFIITDNVGKHPLYMIQCGRQQEYIDILVNGISKVARTIMPKPMIVRFSDFKTNEYKNLEGGEQFEPHEENPMIGWRGISRYISPDFIEAFKLELRAIKKCRDQGLKNVHVMLPFVRNTDEVMKCLDIMRSEGLVKSNDFGVYLMAEVPAIAIMPEEFAELPITGASIGSNDLTQGILCVDRDSTKLGKMGYFDERNPAVLKGISNIIRGFKKHGKTIGLCGQAGSEYDDFVEFLVKEGITSISVNPDVVAKTRRLVASTERNLLLGKLRVS